MGIFDAFGGRWTNREVVAAEDCGSGVFGASVRKGTRGRVVEYREGWMNDSVEVEFEHGQREIVRPSDIRPRNEW